MSISAQGNETFACVCRCRNGVRSAPRPVIHILAGEKVCIQAIRPMHSGSALAAMITRWIELDSVSTGCHATGTGNVPASLSWSTRARDCCSTWSRVSGP